MGPLFGIDHASIFVDNPMCCKKNSKEQFVSIQLLEYQIWVEGGLNKLPPPSCYIVTFFTAVTAMS